MHLLVAENDPALGIFLQRSFGAERYSVDLTQNGEQARSLVRENEYDLAILDLSLPKEEGAAVLRHLRISRQHMPILVLTSRSQITERTGELDLGADDFVVKPFAFSELSARVRALLKRGARSPESMLRVDDLELNRVEHSVRRGSRAIELTPKEYSLLEFLMRNAGQRVTRSQIIEHVWNLSHDTMTNVVDVYINYSSSQVDKRKVGQIAIAIQVAFQQMGIFDASNTRPEVSNSEPMPFSKVQMVENQERIQAMGRLVNAPRGALGETPDRPDMNEIQKQLQTALAAQIGKHTVSVTPTKEGIVVSLREMGFFDSGSTSLRPEAEPTLADFVGVIGPRRVRVRIEGHTDNVPIHNSRFASNWELSTSRATEIIKLLITKYEITPLRLSASGYSEFYPVASNATPEGRAMNRRIDLVILNSQADSAPPVPTKAATNAPTQTSN
jgi:DNA-binding response OmpR family regulator/outer membrane protein OmpA-like peptidoglycan-associated protein